MKRKSVLIILFITLIGSSFLIIKCDKNSVEAETDLVENVSSNEKSGNCELGSFSSGEPEITVSKETLDSIYRWFYGTMEMEVKYKNAYIDDDLSENSAVIYLIFEGSLVSGEGSAILGLQLERDYDDEIYYPSEALGGKWTCTGSNCNGCSPVRKGGRWSKVTGCNCSGSPIDPSKPSGCNHSISGGGNGAAWVGVVVSIVGFFL